MSWRNGSDNSPGATAAYRFGQRAFFFPVDFEDDFVFVFAADFAAGVAMLFEAGFTAEGITKI